MSYRITTTTYQLWNKGVLVKSFARWEWAFNYMRTYNLMLATIKTVTK